MGTDVGATAPRPSAASIVARNWCLSDSVRVVVGGNGPLDPREIETLLQARLRVRPEVLVQDIGLVTATMTGGGERKAKRFFDFRNR